LPLFGAFGAFSALPGFAGFVGFVGFAPSASTAALKVVFAAAIASLRVFTTASRPSCVVTVAIAVVNAVFAAATAA
jgi:hypothetical protein